MRILLTGSSGQIGTNLAKKLLKNGYDVFGIDKRMNSWTEEYPTLLQDLSVNFNNYKNGIGNVDYGSIDLVVHLAANAKVHELVEHPERARDNFLMTFNVIEYCRINNVPLIFSSTREVYGDIKRYVTNEKDASFATTESPYSASKISSEAFIYSYAKCYDMKYIAFRFSNVYGRFDNDIERMERVIPLFFNKIKKNEPIVVYGKEKVLDFTYVDDCVHGIYNGIERLLNGSVVNETFNLAYGEGSPLTQVIDSFEEVLDKKANVSYENARIGEVTQYVADISSAKKLLDYNPQTKLTDGLKKAAKWYSQN